MSQQENTVLLIYRMVGGRRIPYHLELDPTMTVIADRPNLELLQSQALATQQASMARHEQTHTAILTQTMQARQAHAEAVIDKAVEDGKVVATTDPTILQKYPELAPSMKGEVLEERKLPNGGTQIVYKPTPADITMGAWVMKLVTDNPIPGTDELRAEYFAEEEALRDRHAQNGTVCKPCETGALMRKWRAKLEALGFVQ